MDPSASALAQLSALYGSDGSEDACETDDSQGAPSKRRRIEACEATDDRLAADSARCPTALPQRDSSPLAQPTLPPPPLDDHDDAVNWTTGDDGRVRQFDHVDGHYAVHVYVPVSLHATLRAALRQCATDLAEASASSRERVHALDPSEYHISLSRTAMLPRHELDGFLDALRMGVRGCAPLSLPFSGTLCELANDHRTRFFAALECGQARRGHAASGGALVDAVDAVFARYRQQRFYEERRLHFSIAWSLAPLPRLPSRLPTAAAGAERAGLLVDSVCCRIGERTTTFRLSTRGP